MSEQEYSDRYPTDLAKAIAENAALEEKLRVAVEALEYISGVEKSLKVYLGPERFEDLIGIGLGAEQALSKIKGASDEEQER